MTNTRRRKVKVHFNRINMQRGLPTVWTVHTSDACYQVEEVEIRVPVLTKYRPTARQPRAFFSGFAHIAIQGGTRAVLY